MPAVNTSSSPGCGPGCRSIPSRCPRSTSPRSPPAASCSPPTIPADGSTGWGDHGGHHRRHPAGPGPAGQVPGPYRLPRPADGAGGRTPADRTTCSSPSMGSAGTTTARAVSSATGLITAARSSGCPSTPASPLDSLRGPRSSGVSWPGGSGAAGDNCGGRPAGAPDNPRRLWSGATPGAWADDPFGHGPSAQPARVPGRATARCPPPGPGHADRLCPATGSVCGGRAGERPACRVDAGARRGPSCRAQDRRDGCRGRSRLGRCRAGCRHRIR